MPLAALNAITASAPSAISTLYSRVASTANIHVPKFDPAPIRDEIVAFEDRYKSTIPTSVHSEAERARAAVQRMKRVLEEPEYRYRSVSLLAKRAAIAESEAEDLLRADPEIVFSKSDAGETIARLSSR